MVKYFLVYLVSLLCFGATAELNTYYQNQLGERDFPLYYGKFYPDFQFGQYLGEVNNIDDEIYTKYQYKALDLSLYDLNNYLRVEFSSGVLCPNMKMAEHMDYIQYSYRLISMSYLFEALLHYSEVSRGIKGLAKCQTNFADLIKSCNPTSREMKYFKSEALSYTQNIKKIRKSSKLYSVPVKSISHMKKSSKSIYAQRLKSYCLNYPCGAKFSKNVNNMCELDKKLFKQICSEKDQLMGMSYSADPYVLLSRSHIVNNFNEMGQALGCMRRYSQLMRYKEDKLPHLATIFPTIREKLNDAFGERFLQGMLFLPGALKEFREKGLEKIFEEPVKVAKDIPTIKAAPKKRVVPRAVLPKKNPIKLVVKRPTPVKKKTVPKDIRTAFKQAVDLLQELDLDSSDVDMLKFKYDYVFTTDMKERLEAPLERFMKQKSIKQMKKLDKLGSKEGPVPLLFLKYMIDTNKHQGLYNLKLVLGEKFYVKNNVDKGSSEVSFIKLDNNPQTNYQWKISVLSQN